eukprot:scaffold95084_cov23-Tisochrysis_lutea.AAC.1
MSGTCSSEWAAWHVNSSFAASGTSAMRSFLQNTFCKQYLDQCLARNANTVESTDCCVLYKEGEYEEARAKFQEAMAIIGYQPSPHCLSATGAAINVALIVCSCSVLVVMKQYLFVAYPQPELQYNIALCFYKTKQLGQALKHIAEIIERGVRDHPELSVGSVSELASWKMGGEQYMSIPKPCGPA